mmetsp:Transcript_26376/g.82180  ORF Transcript_26376/g.82180 Transcript_26376/m.82180 type:complete len:212 (-) Transcript_26376:467-1102(-)
MQHQRPRRGAQRLHDVVEAHAHGGVTVNLGQHVAHAHAGAVELRPNRRHNGGEVRAAARLQRAANTPAGDVERNLSRALKEPQKGVERLRRGHVRDARDALEPLRQRALALLEKRRVRVVNDKLEVLSRQRRYKPSGVVPLKPRHNGFVQARKVPVAAVHRRCRAVRLPPRLHEVPRHRLAAAACRLNVCCNLNVKRRRRLCRADLIIGLL